MSHHLEAPPLGLVPTPVGRLGEADQIDRWSNAVREDALERFISDESNAAIARALEPVPFPPRNGSRHESITYTQMLFGRSARELNCPDELIPEVVMHLITPALRLMPEEGGRDWFGEAERAASDLVSKLPEQRDGSGTSWEVSATAPTTVTSDQLEVLGQSIRTDTPLEHLILINGSSFYLLDPGSMNYQGPMTSAELQAEVRGLQPLEPHGVQVWKYTDFEPKPIAIETLVRRHGRRLARVEGRYGITAPQYDARTGMFTEALAPIRLTSERDEIIEGWLRILGPQVEKWVANVPDMSRLMAILYLFGPKGIGKGLLASGIARLWGSSPVDFKSVAGDFEEDILNSPFIWADEQLPRRRDKDITALLRALAGNSVHAVRRKHRCEIHVRGALRLLLTANNPDMVEGLQQDLTRDDIDAVMERFAFVEGTPQARDYLDEQKRAGLNLWTHFVEENRLARHALWMLESGRWIPDPVERFVCGGGGGVDVRDRALLSGENISRLVQYVVKLINKRSVSDLTDARSSLLVGEWTVLLNAGAVTEMDWRELVPGVPMLSPARVTKALSSISTGVVRPRALQQMSFRALRVDLLRKWIEMHGVGSLADLDRKMAKPSEVIASVRAQFPDRFVEETP
jgi:hypothetical protein